MEIKIRKEDKPEIKELKLLMLEKNFSIQMARKISGVNERTLYHWFQGGGSVRVNVVKVINRLKKAKPNL